MNTNEVMEQLEPDICKSVRYFWSELPRRTLLEIPDLMNEAMLVLLHAGTSYDPNRGATFKTHFINRLNYRFKDLVREERCHNMASLDDCPEPVHDGTSRFVTRLRGLQGLSVESRTLRRKALSPPKRLLKRVLGRRPVRSFEIRRAFDMSKKEYTMAVSEILEALNGDI